MRVGACGIVCFSNLNLEKFKERPRRKMAANEAKGPGMEVVLFQKFQGQKN